MALNFCGSLFLRIGDFLCFVGTKFLLLEKTGFSCWESMFEIFWKSRSNITDNIFVFFFFI